MTAAPLTVPGCLHHPEPHAGRSSVQCAVINKTQDGPKPWMEEKQAAAVGKGGGVGWGGKQDKHG